MPASRLEQQAQCASGAEVQSAPFVSFVTLGCAKNEVDTANMLARVMKAGYRVCDDPEQSDICIVNTCSFIQAATEESLQAIFELSALKGFADGSKKIVAAGCLPARYGEQLSDELNEAAAFVPCSKEDDIVAVLERLTGLPAPVHGSGDAASIWGYSAYVKISDGCDRFCSFCAIPYIRGPYHSFSLESISDNVSNLVESGIREITLIAQDTGRWGEDFNPPSSTAHLLSTLAERFPQTWFRLMYIEPVGITDDLLRTIARYDNICNYLDMPLQHASQRILGAMNRSGSFAENLALVKRIRTVVPDITLRTTVMVGFPGETEQDFSELLEMLEEAEFDYVGAFQFSPEEGTRAAQLPDQLDDEVKSERFQEVRDLADSISYAKVAARVGQRMKILVLGTEEDGQLFGRAMCQAPEVDGVVFLSGGEPGSVIEATIEDTLLYEMEAQ